MSRKKTLGRGLGALIESSSNIQEESMSKAEITTGLVQMIDINKIQPRENQPRKNFDEDSINELSASIKDYGLLQPLLLSKKGDKFEIIAGERRFRASKLAGLKDLPAVVKDSDEEEIQIISLIENIQREDLNPIEEALSYMELMEDYDYTQEDLSKLLGKSRSYIANASRLLKLEENIQEALIKGQITSSQGRTLLSIKDPKERQVLFQNLLDKKTNIRSIEEEARSSSQGYKSIVEKNIYVEDLENRLTDALSAKVRLKTRAKGGKIEIEYYDNEDLERITNILEKGDLN